MLLRKVILENYGLYRGRNEFDLIPKKQPHGKNVKPIILFGGKNGAGKTTLLDAVRLTLYGKQSLGASSTLTVYHDYLDGKIHRSQDVKIQQQWARIAVEFDFVTRGEQERYYVERRWRRIPEGGIDEKLEILKNGHTVDDIESKHWEAFAASIVPERLSQLFFFDGEKIKAMAEDISGSAAVRESINSLLGLDMIDRLKADLNLYQSKEAKKYSSVEDQKLLEKVEVEIQVIEGRVIDLRKDYIAREDAIQELNEQIQAIENELHAAGSAYANRRVAEQQNQSESESQIDMAAKQMRLECEGPFPLALCPKLAKQLIEQLEAESVVKGHSTVADAVEKMRVELQKVIGKTKSIDAAGRKDALVLIDQVASEQSTLPRKYQDTEVIHNLSPQSAFHIRDWLQASSQSTKNIKKLASELETLHRQQQKASTVIARAPDQEALKPIVERLNEASGQTGKLRAEQEAISEEIRQHLFRQNELDREKKKLETKVLSQKKFIDQTELIKNTQKALSVYQKRLTQMKIETLQQTITECFNHLVRKEDLLHGISIDAKTFKVTLHDSRDNAIPKEDLSSGEKQIYAISVLWGLAKTSGRPLPVIIDTPLGRLDSDHRRNLIENYFPNAGHQVILLSTDTEVDESLYTKLQPHISHCYHLKYNDRERYTSSKQEYFWKENKNG